MQRAHAQQKMTQQMLQDHDDEMGLGAALRNRNSALRRNSTGAGDQRRRFGRNQKWRSACEQIQKNHAPFSTDERARSFFCQAL
jgi:hypothetical protein